MLRKVRPAGLLAAALAGRFVLTQIVSVRPLNFNDPVFMWMFHLSFVRLLKPHLGTLRACAPQH